MDSIMKATNTTLSKYNKNTTPPTIFHQLFRAIKSSYPNHNFVYTDGSKSGGLTTYRKDTIKLGLLPLSLYFSVLSSDDNSNSGSHKNMCKDARQTCYMHRLLLLHLLDHQP